MILRMWFSHFLGLHLKKHEDVHLIDEDLERGSEVQACLGMCLWSWQGWAMQVRDRLGPGTLAAVLAAGQPSPGQQNTKKLQGTKNNYVHAQLGWIMNSKTQKDPKTLTATSEGPEAETRCWEQKRVTLHVACTQHQQSSGQPPEPPSGLTPICSPTFTSHKESACPMSWSKQVKEHVTWSHSPLLQQGPQ